MSDTRPRHKDGITVLDTKARQMVELLEAGTPLQEAEEQVGVTLAQLRSAGGLSRTVRGLMSRISDANLLLEENQKKAARARLTELMLQDEDQRVALNAAKALLGTDSTQVAVINNISGGGPPTDPAILEALKSLGIYKETETDE